jgi:hypothetical protein
MIRSTHVRPIVVTGWGIERKTLGNGLDLVRTTFSHDRLVTTGEPFGANQHFSNALRDIREDVFPNSFSTRFWKFVSDQLYDLL